MRIETKLTLTDGHSAEDNDLVNAWGVHVSATVREFGNTDTEPGELLIEDIEINEVYLDTRIWGRIGQTIIGDSPFAGMVAIENQRRLEWLNSVLHERENWFEAIRAAVVKEYAKAV